VDSRDSLPDFLNPMGRSNDTLVFVDPKTPDAKIRRAPPAPPLPDIPLPPTPTIAGSERAFDWDAMVDDDEDEMVVGDDWVNIDDHVDGWVGWSRAGKGVGLLGITGTILCSVSFPVRRADSG